MKNPILLADIWVEITERTLEQFKNMGVNGAVIIEAVGYTDDFKIPGFQVIVRSARPLLKKL